MSNRQLASQEDDPSSKEGAAAPQDIQHTEGCFQETVSTSHGEPAEHRDKGDKEFTSVEKKAAEDFHQLFLDMKKRRRLKQTPQGEQHRSEGGDILQSGSEPIRNEKLKLLLDEVADKRLKYDQYSADIAEKNRRLAEMQQRLKLRQESEVEEGAKLKPRTVATQTSDDWQRKQKGASAQVIAKDNRIKELTTRVHELETAGEEMRRALHDKELEIVQHNHKMTRLSEGNLEKQRTLSTALAQARNQAERTRQHVTVLETQLSTERVRHAAELKERDRHAEEQEHKTRELEAAKLRLEARCVELQDKVSEAYQEVANLQNKVAELEEDKGNLQLHLVDFDELKVAESHWQKQVAELEECLSTTTSERGHLQNVAEQQHLQISTLEATLAKHSESLTELQNAKVCAEMKAVELEEQVDALSHEVDKKGEKEFTNQERALRHQGASQVVNLQDAQEKFQIELEKKDFQIQELQNFIEEQQSKLQDTLLCLQKQFDEKESRMQSDLQVKDTEIQQFQAVLEKYCLELNEALSQQHQLQQEGDDRKAQLMDKNSKVEQLLLELEQGQANAERLETRLKYAQEIESQLAHATTNLNVKEDELLVTQTQLEQANNKVSELVTKNKKLVANLKLKVVALRALEEKANEHSAILEEKERRITELMAERENIVVTGNLTAELQEKTELVCRLTAELDSVRQEVLEKEAELSAVQESLSAAQEALKHTQTMSNALSEDRVVLITKLEESETHRKLMEQTHSAESEEISVLKLSEKSLKEELQEKDQIISELAAEKESLCLSVGICETLRQDLDEKNRFIKETLTEMENLRNNIVMVENMKAELSIKEKRILEILEENNNLVSMQALLLSQVEEKDKVIVELNNNLASASGAVKMVKAELLQEENQITDLGVEREDHIVQLSAVNPLQIDVQEIKQQISQLCEERDNLKAQLMEKEKATVMLQDALDKKVQEVLELRSQQSWAKQQEAAAVEDSLQQELERAGERCGRLEEMMSEADQQRRDLEARVEELCFQLQDSQRERDAVAENEALLEQRLAELLTSESTLRERLLTLSEAHEEAQRRIRDLEKDLNSLSREVPGLRRGQDQLRELEEAYASATQRIDALETELQRTTTESDRRIRTAAEDARRHAESIESDLRSVSSQLNQAESERRILREEFEKATDEKTVLEQELEALRDQLGEAQALLARREAEIQGYEAHLLQLQPSTLHETADHLEQHNTRIKILESERDSLYRELLQERAQSEVSKIVTCATERVQDIATNVCVLDQQPGSFVQKFNVSEVQPSTVKQDSTPQHQATEHLFGSSEQETSTAHLFMTHEESTSAHLQGSRQQQHISVSHPLGASIQQQTSSGQLFDFFTATHRPEEQQQYPMARFRESQDDAAAQFFDGLSAGETLSEECEAVSEMTRKMTKLQSERDAAVVRLRGVAREELDEERWSWCSDEGRLEEEHRQRSVVPVLEGQIQKLQTEQNRLSDELKTSHVRAGKLLKKLKELKLQNDTLMKENLEASKHEVASGLDLAIEEELRVRIEGLEKEVRDLRSERDNLSQRTDVLTTANEHLIEMKERQDLELEAWQRRSRELAQKVESTEWHIAELLAEREESQQDRAHLRKEVEQLSKEQAAAAAVNTNHDGQQLKLFTMGAPMEDDKEKRIADLINEIQRKDSEITDLKKQLATSEEHWKSNVELLNQELEVTSQALIQGREKHDALLKELQEKLRQSDSSRQQMEELWRAKEGEVEQLKMCLSEAERKVDMLRSSVTEVPSIGNVELQAQLTEALQTVESFRAMLDAREQETEDLRCQLADQERDSEERMFVREEDLQSLRTQLSQSLLDTQNLREVVEEKGRTIRRLEAEQQSLKVQLQDNESVVELWDTIKLKEDEMCKLKGRVTELESECNMLRDQVSQEGTAALNEALELKDREVKELMDIIKSLETKCDSQVKKCLEDNEKVVADLQMTLEAKCHDVTHLTDLLALKNAELDELQNQKLGVNEDVKKIVCKLNNSVEVKEREIKALKDKLASLEAECCELLAERGDEDSKKLVLELRAVLDVKEREIRDLEDRLGAREAECRMLRVHREEHQMDTVALSEEDNQTPSDERSELDVALYMLHQRDVRCDELTLELMQLLEERDTLQLRLSNAIRINEELRASLSTFPVTTARSSAPGEEIPEPLQVPASQGEASVERPPDLQVLASKLSQLHSVDYRRDVTLRDDREQRHSDQMRLLQQPRGSGVVVDADYTLSRDVQSSSTVLLNWLRGRSTPRVMHV